MRARCHALALAAALLGAASLAAAPEDEGAVMARVRLEPARVFIGTPATLTVEVEGPAGLRVDGEPLGRALGELGGARPAPMRRLEAPGDAGRVRYLLEAEFLRFELGSGPGVQVALSHEGSAAGSGTLELWLPEPEVVDVPALAGDQQHELRAAKGAVAPPRDLWPWWANIALLLAVGAGLGGLLKRARRVRPAPPPPPSEPPFDRAMRLLTKLEREGDQGDPRSYHYRLSEVLREYLCARYQLPGLSETSFELVTECRAAGLEDLLVERVERLLSALDLIKFGPEEVGSDRSPLHLAQCQDLVRGTEPLPPRPAVSGGES